MTGSNSLNVYLGNALVATLSLNQEQLRWKYSAKWQNNGFPVSPHLPFYLDRPSINVNRFLRNMLPEGYAFEELLQNFHVSRNNTFSLIKALGLDTPGALIFKSKELNHRDENVFRDLTKKELTARLDKRSNNSLIIWDGKPRLSVAGVQDKINVVVKEGAQIGFGEGNLCSTHILKFEREGQKNLVLNEYLTMRLAKKCGLNCANVWLHEYGKHHALLVERFDRKMVNNSTVQRRHIIDGCQALNLPPDYKYEQNFGHGRDVAHIRDGASLQLLLQFTNKCENPALTKQKILDWVLFNVLVYNADAHGKNISFYVGKQGISLAPFYDLVNIKVYPDLNSNFAMALGDEFDSDNVNAYQLADFAESYSLSRRYISQRLQLMIEKMQIALPEEVSKLTSKDAQFLNEYQKIIQQRCKHLYHQCKEITTIDLYN